MASACNKGHRILTIEKARIRMEVKGAQARQIEEREG
jgi:hypothetical protein